MDPKFFQVVSNLPAEGHAAAHIAVLSNVVLYKNCCCLRSANVKISVYLQNT